MATVFTDTARALLANVLNNTALAAQPKYVAWGTGAGTAARGDTTLFTEASEARTSGTTSRFTTTSTNDSYRVVGTITATGSKTITNAGLFDASTSGNMFVKGDFTGVALVANDAIQFTIEVVFS